MFEARKRGIESQESEVTGKSDGSVGQLDNRRNAEMINRMCRGSCRRLGWRNNAKT